MRLACRALAIEKIARLVEMVQDDAELFKQLDVSAIKCEGLRCGAPGFLRKKALGGEMFPHVPGAFKGCHDRRLTWHKSGGVQNRNIRGLSGQRLICGTDR